MPTPSSATFTQAVPRRQGIALLVVCLALAAVSAYLLVEGVRFLRTPLVGGPQVLAAAVPIALLLLLTAGAMVWADRIGRDARLTLAEDVLVVRSRGVLTQDLVVPLAELTGVTTHPKGFASSQLPRGAASLTPLSMGPWLELTVNPRRLPARRSSWMWRWLVRSGDFTHVPTPSSGRTCSVLLFGTRDADVVRELLRDLLDRDVTSGDAGR